MAYISKIKNIQVPSFQIDIPDFPYLLDHCFENKPVLPAVEICELLAFAVKDQMQKQKQNIDVLFITEAVFNKFLLLESAQNNKIEIFCDFVLYENNDVKASLKVKRKGSQSSIVRTVEHACMIFSQNKKLDTACHLEKISGKISGKKDDRIEVLSKKIYNELVPFGPAYRNIKELLIYKKGAVAKIKAPVQSECNNEIKNLGSPFVLDAAFHAACVYGQRFYFIVPFPVGFKERIIYKKTEQGFDYTATIIYGGKQKEELFFDIIITDAKEDLCEFVKGVKMADVSRGRIKPPDWILDKK